MTNTDTDTVDADMIDAVASGGDRVLGGDNEESVAQDWLDCGLTAQQAREYIAAGCWCADSVLELVVAGVTADEIASLELQEGERSSVAYSHSNCDVSTAEVLHRVQAVRS